MLSPKEISEGKLFLQLHILYVFSGSSPIQKDGQQDIRVSFFLLKMHFSTMKHMYN